VTRDSGLEPSKGQKAKRLKGKTALPLCLFTFSPILFFTFSLQSCRLPVFHDLILGNVLIINTLRPLPEHDKKCAL